MKILVIRSFNPFTKPSASNNRFLSLAEGLVANGCKIDMVFTSVITNTSEMKNFGYLDFYKGMSYQYLIPYNCSKKFKRQLLIKTIFSNYFLSKKLAALISENNYDVVWLDFSTQVIKI